MKRRTFKEIIKNGFLRLWEDIRFAKWVIIFIIAYFVFLKRFLYSTCPVVLITGFPCPACGLTRAGTRMLCLDFTGAFEIHPFIFPIAALILIFCFNRYILFKKMPERMKWCLIIVIVSMVIFYIWRMINHFPGEPPMSFYGNNMIHMLKQFVF